MGVEAAHIGPLPLSAAIGVTLFDGPLRYMRCSSVAHVRAAAQEFVANAPPPMMYVPPLPDGERVEMQLRLRRAHKRLSRIRPSEET